MSAGLSGGLNEDATPAGDGEKRGGASSAGDLNQDAPADAPAEEVMNAAPAVPAPAEEDMELNYYRLQKALFNMLVFPPDKTVAANTKFKPLTQTDNIRHVFHTWNNYDVGRHPSVLRRVFQISNIRGFAECKPIFIFLCRSSLKQNYD